MQSNEKIIEIVKKLLALGGNNPNREEANAAIAKANALMLKYNLERSQIEKEDLNEYGNEDMATQGVSGVRLIRLIVKEFFFVDVLIYARQKRWTFVGTKVNVEIAVYMFWHIKRKFDEAWVDYRKNASDLMHHSKNDYYMGLYQGLKDKLESEKERLKQEEGLVWLGDPNIKKYEMETWGKQLVQGGRYNMNSGSSGDGDAQDHGYKKGRNMNLEKGISHGATKQNLLGGS